MRNRSRRSPSPPAHDALRHSRDLTFQREGPPPGMLGLGITVVGFPASRAVWTVYASAPAQGKRATLVARFRLRVRQRGS